MSDGFKGTMADTPDDVKARACAHEFIKVVKRIYGDKFICAHVLIGTELTGSGPLKTGSAVVAAHGDHAVMAHFLEHALGRLKDKVGANAIDPLKDLLAFHLEQGESKLTEEQRAERLARLIKTLQQAGEEFISPKKEPSA